MFNVIIDYVENLNAKIKTALRRILRYWPWVIGGGLITIVFFGVFTYFYYVGDLATAESLMNRNNIGLVLYDRTGKAIFKSEGVKDFQPVLIENIPKKLTDATIAIEDKEFYSHPGFSIRAIARSLYNNLLSASPVRFGGSTITQQLVKNALLSPEKSVQRKYQEIILSFEVERRYSKDKILEMYLNSIYYGAGAYGVEEASKTYFNKSVGQITLGEAAILAALPQAPSRLTPFGGDSESLDNRKNLVLDQMEMQGYITRQEKDQAKKEEIKYADPPADQTNSQAPHFALFVRDLLYEKYGEDEVRRSGFRVTTTLDLALQQRAQTILTNQVKRLIGQKVTNGGLVTINPNSGEVLVMVGSTDWDNEQFGKFNVAFAKRQPGSAFKPIVYTQAFAEGHKTIDLLSDRATNFNGYQPKNYDNKFRGDVTIRRALANSLNVPSVALLQKVGVADAIQLARAMGITTLTDPSRYGLALVLGGGEVELFELTRAYGVLATSGKLVNSHFILSIEDKFDNKIYIYDPVSKSEEKSQDGIENLLNFSQTEGREFIGGEGDRQIIDEVSTYLTTHILSDDQSRSEIFGSGSALLLSRQAGAKTGTTDDFRDAWTVGYTPDYVTGVWIGNNDNTPMGRVAGSIGAAPIWHDVMESVHRGKPVRNFARPSSVIEVTICLDNFQFACKDCQRRGSEVFRAREAPKSNCPEDLSPTPEPSAEPTPTPEPTTAPTAEPTSSPTTNPTPTTILSPTIGPSIIVIP